MVETIEIGPGPCDEHCAQINTPDFTERNRAECRAFINQIKRALGEPPEGASLFIRSNPHDYGSYREVVAKVSGVTEENAREKALEYAYRCESDSPATWDDEARRTGRDGLSRARGGVTMFHTIRYRGHHIHVSVLDGIETIKTQISTADGRFDLQTRKTYAGAQRAITKHVRAIAAAA